MMELEERQRELLKLIAESGELERATMLEEGRLGDYEAEEIIEACRRYMWLVEHSDEATGGQTGVQSA